MMMLTDLNGGIRAPPAHLHNTSPAGLSVTPTAASANANANRRPRAHSMHQFGGSDKSLGSPSAARGGGGDCNASGSFVSKLFCMVDSEPSSIVSWTRGGTAFCIVDPKMMAEHCLPKYFRHRRFSSLIRQLNFYSFYRVQEGQLAIYQHSFFRKGRPDLLVHIKRRGAGKAKDPLFDPLASPTSGTNNNNNNSNKHATKHTNNNQTLNLHVIGTSSNTNPPPLHGMMCYSPMSKPVMMENMSPALKPGIAPSASPPPMVDAMGSSIVFTQQQQPPRWEQQQQDNSDHSFALATAAMKHKFVFTDAGVHGFANHSNSSSHSMVPAPLDLDIQDFLTDDCSITNNSHVNAHTHSYPAFSDDRMSNMHAPKHALVSRDLLKWDSTKCVDDDASSASHVAGLLARHDADDHDGSSSTTSTGTFEDELLLDLANVEPDAWEVPLSPLNEDEDMMPWLDLCF